MKLSYVLVALVVIALVVAAFAGGFFAGRMNAPLAGSFAYGPGAMLRGQGGFGMMGGYGRGFDRGFSPMGGFLPGFGKYDCPCRFGFLQFTFGKLGIFDSFDNFLAPFFQHAHNRAVKKIL